MSVLCLKAKIPLFQFVCHEVHLPCVKHIHVAGVSYCRRFRSVFVSLLALVMSVNCDYPLPSTSPLFLDLYPSTSPLFLD